jgi:hypothetical protein
MAAQLGRRDDVGCSMLLLVYVGTSHRCPQLLLRLLLLLLLLVPV